MENAKCYELTLTPNYVSDWTFNDAIRELIQNGTDQEVLDKENHFSIEYDRERQVLQLKNSKSALKINTLLLGRSSKAGNDDTVGQFGEGYKIAALVLNRIGKTFTVLNNEKNEVWESRFKNSEKWLEKILAFYISKKETEDTGLCIEVGNVSWEEYRGLSDVWMKFDEDDYMGMNVVDTSYGEILTDEDFSGKVYVNGLFVNCNADLKYGYNFKPKYIKLERDRKACDSFDAREITCRMIAEGMVSGDIPIDEVNRMVNENVDDVYNFEYNTYENDVQKVQEVLLNAFDEQNPQPYSIPVSSQDEIKKVKSYGGNPVVVPYKVAKLLKNETSKRIKELVELPSANALTLRDRFNRWYDIYADKLESEARAELKSLIDEME